MLVERSRPCNWPSASPERIRAWQCVVTRARVPLSETARRHAERIVARRTTRCGRGTAEVMRGDEVQSARRATSSEEW